MYWGIASFKCRMPNEVGIIDETGCKAYQELRQGSRRFGKPTKGKKRPRRRHQCDSFTEFSTLHVFILNLGFN